LVEIYRFSIAAAGEKSIFPRKIRERVLNLFSAMISPENCAYTHSAHSQGELPKKDKGAAAAPALPPTQPAHEHIQKTPMVNHSIS